MVVFLDLNKINAYRVSFDLSNQIWDIVIKWNYFAQKTVGVQIVRAVDSISANIARRIRKGITRRIK